MSSTTSATSSNFTPGPIRLPSAAFSSARPPIEARLRDVFRDHLPHGFHIGDGLIRVGRADFFLHCGGQPHPLVYIMPHLDRERILASGHEGPGLPTASVFIPARVRDNRFNNPDYVKVLERLTGWQRRA